MRSVSRTEHKLKLHTPLKALFGLSFFVACLGFVFYAIQTWHKVGDDADEKLHFIDRLLIHTTDEVFSHNQSILRVVGERLLEINAVEYPERGRSLVEHLLRLNPQMAGFGLVRADGQLLLVSGIKPGEKLPSLMAQSESARSFQQALGASGMNIGRTYYLPLLQRWITPLRVAIPDARGAVPLVMSLGIDIDSPDTTWNALQLPDGIEVRILREDGYWQFVKPLAASERTQVYNAQAETSWVQAVHNGSGSADEQLHHHTYDLGDRIGLGTWLPRWKFHTLVTVPRSALIAEYQQRMAIPLTLLVLLLFAGIFLYRNLVRQQRIYEMQLIERAHYDSLTGLPNRLLVMDRLEHALDAAARDSSKVMLVFIDLDHFKRINDSFGHLVGDDLLRQCAERFNRILRAGDTIARLGGDEFLIVLPDIDTLDSVESVVHKIQQVFEQPFLIGHREIFSTCSIGLAGYPDDGATADLLLKAADTALYKAKDAGRNTHRFYSQQMNSEAERRMEIESALRYALENDELGLLYQPQVELESGRWTGCEALLRWNSSLLGEISPVEFIPVAEESGLIRPIGDFVLQEACRDLARIRAVTERHFSMAVNLSAVQLHQQDLPEAISRLLQQHHLDVEWLELEITESTMVENGEQLERLHALGSRIAVDDFGTGFCSLGYLQRFPVTTLKIDRSFVMNIENNQDEAKLVNAIVNLGISLQLDVVAEGIETKAQLDYLYESGCRLGQGYYFSKPIALELLLEKLQQHEKTAAS